MTSTTQDIFPLRRQHSRSAAIPRAYATPLQRRSAALERQDRRPIDLSDQPLLLSVPHVGRLLGLSRSRIYALIASGVIPSRRLSERSIVISRLELQRWLEGGQPA
jgi:excisionase family DNA binding protein